MRKEDLENRLNNLEIGLQGVQHAYRNLVLDDDSLLDHFALEMLKVEVSSWNRDQSEAQRAKYLSYLTQTYGNVSITEGLVKEAYSTAKLMIKEREK